MIYAGGCHCGNLEVRLDSAKSPAELGVRADACSFCARHRAVYTSDPAGQLQISARDPALVERYRFGTRTADFVLCKVCGVFVAAHMPGDQLAVVNVNALDARAAFLANPIAAADFDGESVEQRLARRRARWTPVIV